MKTYHGPPMALRSTAKASVRLIVRGFAHLHEQVAKTRRSTRLISWRITAKTWWRRVWPRIKNWSWTAIWTAIGTCVMALFTIGIYLVGRDQWQTFQQQLTAMQGQLDAMEADQRPWVKVQIKPYQSPIDPQHAGLRFLARPRFNGPGVSVSLPLDFLLKNVGRSPAFDIRFAGEQFFERTDLIKEEREYCAALDTHPPPIMIYVIPVLFPGDEAPAANYGLGTSRTQLNKLEDQGKNGGFQLWLHGCIAYKFANPKETHHTSFAYQVLHIVDASISGGKATVPFFRFGEDISADRISLQPEPAVFGIAN